MTVPNGSNGVKQNGASVPQPRAEWIAQRRTQAEKAGDRNFSQMHYARKGIVTEEMVYIAAKEKISPELVRDEVAAGRMIIPPNINHPDLEPMPIAVPSLSKIHPTIRNSPL